MLVDGCRWMGADCDLDVPEGSAGADGVSSACLMASESRWVRALRSPAALFRVVMSVVVCRVLRAASSWDPSDTRVSLALTSVLASARW